MTETSRSCLLILLFICSTFANQTLNEQPQHFTVYRVTPQDDTQLAFVSRIYDAQAELDLDFWTEPRDVNGSVDVMLAAGEHDWFLQSLSKNDILHFPTIPDVGKLMTERQVKHDDRKYRMRRRKRQNSDAYDFGGYGSYEEMIDYLKSLDRSFPDIVKVFTIGDRTHDGNKIYVIRIGQRDSQREKRAVWIDGGIHAREWAAPHTAMYFIKMLVEGYNKNSEITRFVNLLDFYIVPVLNPDGYKYTMTSSRDARVRMWRKNRRITSHRTCRGVDLNRNYDFSWGKTGSSRNPCSEVYQGESAFSEVESRAMRDAMLHGEAKGRLDAYITLHTYSQMWLHPYGDRKKHYPADRSDLYRVGKKAIDKLSSRYRTKYRTGSAADVLYPASGGSDDWAKANAGIKYVYLLELRPDEIHYDGFILPEDELLPAAKETWDGVREVILAVEQMQGVDAPETNDPSSISLGPCENNHGSCNAWISSQPSLCDRSDRWMHDNCALACGFC